MSPRFSAAGPLCSMGLVGSCYWMATLYLCFIRDEQYVFAWLQSTLHWMYTAGHFNEITACNPWIRGRGKGWRKNVFFTLALNEHARCLTETASFTKPAFALAFKVFYGLHFTVISSYWEREREKEGQNCQMNRNSLLGSKYDRCSFLW